MEAHNGEKTLYIDATNQILGRLASIVAKKLLEGYRVVIVNAEKAVLSGKRLRVIQGYKLLEQVATHYNPYKQGVRRPKSPHNILKRTVRGMLPIDKPRGRTAYKRLRVYNGVPPELGGKEFTRFKEADASRLAREYISLEDIAKTLGWKGAGR